MHSSATTLLTLTLLPFFGSSVPISANSTTPSSNDGFGSINITPPHLLGHFFSLWNSPNFVYGGYWNNISSMLTPSARDDSEEAGVLEWQDEGRGHHEESDVRLREYADVEQRSYQDYEEETEVIPDLGVEQHLVPRDHEEGHTEESMEPSEDDHSHGEESTIEDHGSDEQTHQEKPSEYQQEHHDNGETQAEHEDIIHIEDQQQQHQEIESESQSEEHSNHNEAQDQSNDHDQDSQNQQVHQEGEP